jgi:hypothetical protein
MINDAECGETVTIPEGEYDEAITIHKCITLIAEECTSGDCGDGRALGYKPVKVKQGTGVDFDERDNDGCECNDVNLEGIEFYGSQGQGVIKVKGSGENLLGNLNIRNSIIDGVDGEGTYARGVYIESGESETNINIENTSFYNIGSNYVKIENSFFGSFDGTYNFFDQSEPDGVCNDCEQGDNDECSIFNGSMFSGVNVQTQIGPWYYEDPQVDTEAQTVASDCNGSWGGPAVPNCFGTCSGDCEVFNDTVPEVDECGVCGGDGSECGCTDCDGENCTGLESSVGDGYCDDGTWGLNFDCAEFDFDGGDCESGDIDGDINGDGVLNVLDIVAMVNLVLTGGFDGTADMNDDGDVNVLDVVYLVNLVLGGGLQRGEATTEVTLFLGNGKLSYDSENGTIGGVQLQVNGDFNIIKNNLPVGWELVHNETIILMYSMSGSKLTDETLFEYDGELNIESIIVADWYGSDIKTSYILLPSEFTLLPVYPNPFNPICNFDFSLPIEEKVSITIYNLQGRKMVTLINQNFSAGIHTITWNAKEYMSGIYFVKLIAGEHLQIQKLVLLK